MSQPLIFITGATGFIGAHVVTQALSAGYHVRLSVRKEAQISNVRKVFSSHSANLDFVVVPDFTSTGAFEKALHGVTHLPSCLSHARQRRRLSERLRQVRSRRHNRPSQHRKDRRHHQARSHCIFIPRTHPSRRSSNRQIHRQRYPQTRHSTSSTLTIHQKDKKSTLTRR